MVGVGVMVGVAVGPGVLVDDVELASTTTMAPGSRVVPIEGAQLARGEMITIKSRAKNNRGRLYVFRTPVSFERLIWKFIVPSRHVN
jgi:hypothetical protein